MTHLIGKVIIKGTIEVKTGMRIGGTTGGLKIGGVDSPVITDAQGRPYIPGSSLKGKMRSLMEIREGKSLDSKSGLHECQSEKEYKECDVCKIWGIRGERQFSIPTLTRLNVRDTYLDEESFTDEMHKNLELKWTEVKTEINIDRRTGTVSRVGGLRFAERVPAGAKFKDCEMVYNVFEEGDKDLLKKVFEAMELLEQDYLGGMGSRGYGKIAFKDIEIYWNKKEDYENGKIGLIPERKINGDLDTPVKLVEKFGDLKEKLS